MTISVSENGNKTAALAMTHLFRILFCLAAGLAAKDSAISQDIDQTIFLHAGQPVKLQGTYHVFQPVPTVVDTPVFDLKYRELGQVNLPADSLSPLFTLGTQYLVPAHYLQRTNLIPTPPHRVIRNCYQVVITRDTGHVGHLQEMLNVPFVMPPRIQGPYGHQTDNRVAVDCAAMAIYARRRSGHQIPYVGPTNIDAYLQPADSLFPGVILHFGHQVSSLYRDNGQQGVLDADDLLIHAYKGCARIERLGDTDLKPEKARILWWK
jgi:hypothetical protein